MVWPTVLRLWCHSWPVVCVCGSHGEGSLGSQDRRTCPETTSQPLCREGGRSQPAGSRASGLKGQAGICGASSGHRPTGMEHHFYAKTLPDFISPGREKPTVHIN